MKTITQKSKENGINQLFIWVQVELIEEFINFEVEPTWGHLIFVKLPLNWIKEIKFCDLSIFSQKGIEEIYEETTERLTRILFLEQPHRKYLETLDSCQYLGRDYLNSFLNREYLSSIDDIHIGYILK